MPCIKMALCSIFQRIPVLVPPEVVVQRAVSTGKEVGWCLPVLCLQCVALSGFCYSFCCYIGPLLCSDDQQLWVLVPAVVKDTLHVLMTDC